MQKQIETGIESKRLFCSDFGDFLRIKVKLFNLSILSKSLNTLHNCTGTVHAVTGNWIGKVEEKLTEIRRFKSSTKRSAELDFLAGLIQGRKLRT